MAPVWITFWIMAWFLKTAHSFEVYKCCHFGISLDGDYYCNVKTDNSSLSWFPFDHLRNYKSGNLTKGEIGTIRNLIQQPGFVGVEESTELFAPDFNIHVRDKTMYDTVFRFDVEGFEKTLEFSVPVSKVCFDQSISNDSVTHVVGYFWSNTMINKCCSMNAILNMTSGSCVEVPPHWQDWYHWKPHNKSGKLEDHILAMTIPPHFNPPSNCHLDIWKNPSLIKKCKGFVNFDNLEFLANGSIDVSGHILNSEEYCGEKSWHEGDVIYYNLLYCRPTKKTSNYTKLLLGIVFIIGGMCLLLTVVISLMLPELRRKIHNKIAITHNASLMVAHFIWGIVQLITFSSVDVSTQTCATLALLIQFTFLGSLFWLNAMCINMSSTFRTTQNIESQSARGEARRYAIYSAYAWGLTSVISIFTITMEYIDEPPYGILRPGFSCYCDFARNTISVFIYFYGPMVVILLFNLVLYIFTTWKIMKSIMNTRADSKKTGGASLNNERQRLILYTKLFFLMGLTWMTEILGWAVGADNNTAIITFLDIINLMRAVFIFIIFICKKSVFENLQIRFLSATGRLRRSGSSMRSTTDAISLSTVGSSRKVSRQEDSGRKRSRDQDLVDQKTGLKVHKEWTETSKPEGFDSAIAKETDLLVLDISESQRENNSKAENSKFL